MHTEISSDAHHFTNAGDNHNACDTSDEDPRPAQRRKPRSARAVTSPFYLRRSPSPPPTTRAEIDEAQSQDGHGCSSTFTAEQHCASRTSRSPSAAPVAEYQEWPFQGFLKRIRIGDDVMYNLEFKLPSISEHLQLPIHPKALDICPSKEGRAKVPITHDATAHSKMHQAPPQPEKRRVKWTPEEEATRSRWERWLFVGKDPCCPPSPKHRDHPGALFDEVEEVIRRFYEVWDGRIGGGGNCFIGLGLSCIRFNMAKNGDSREA